MNEFKHILPLHSWNEVANGIYIYNFQQNICWYELHIVNWDCKEDGIETAIANLYTVDNYVRRNSQKGYRIEHYLRRSLLAERKTVIECLQEADDYFVNMVD